MRIGIMGGTFDPIHRAHLHNASRAASACGLDQVVLVPTGEPCHKDPRAVSPSADRFAMAAIACRPHPLLSVSRVELDRPGPSHTVPTLQEFRRRLGPEAELFLIVGTDTAEGMSQWHQAEAIPRLARLVVCGRADHVPDPGRLPRSGLYVPASPRPWRISSTQIRARIRDGRPVRHLLPDGVAAYIAERGLYLDRAVHQESY
ncbi:nicotinate-nucleotide adenylyltransferase [Streptomyces sp. NBC_01275]|nr:nicotinate-nucleotide adenylyltransferase [Streptomyces sp. NBC_01275]